MGRVGRIAQWWRLAGFVAFAAAMVALIPDAAGRSRVYDCDEDEDDCDGGEARVLPTRREPMTSPAPSKGARSGPFNYYRAFLADPGATAAFQFLKVRRDLWQPFAWEVTTGLFAPDGSDNATGLFGTELDVERSDPLRFFGFYCQWFPAQGGVNVFVADDTGTHDALFFPGTRVVDLRIVATGTELQFSARPRGTGEYQLVETLPFSGQTEPLHPAIGMFNMRGGAEIGFDNERVVESAPPPATPTAEQQVAETLYGAYFDQFEGAYDLDGAAPDFPAATAHLEAARAKLEAALVSLDGLARAPKAPQIGPVAAAKYARKSIKKNGSALKALSKRRPPAGKKLEKLLKGLDLARQYAHEAVKRLEGSD